MIKISINKFLKFNLINQISNITTEKIINQIAFEKKDLLFKLSENKLNKFIDKLESAFNNDSISYEIEKELNKMEFENYEIIQLTQEFNEKDKFPEREKFVNINKFIDNLVNKNVQNITIKIFNEISSETNYEATSEKFTNGENKKNLEETVDNLDRENTYSSSSKSLESKKYSGLLQKKLEDNDSEEEAENSKTRSQGGQ